MKSRRTKNRRRHRGPGGKHPSGIDDLQSIRALWVSATDVLEDLSQSDKS